MKIAYSAKVVFVQSSQPLTQIITLGFYLIKQLVPVNT